MATDMFFASASFLRTTLYVLLWTLIFKYITDKFRRDPRFVKFAAALPGPLDFPLIGNGLEFLYYALDDCDTIFSGYAKKYGSVYRMWIGKQLVVGLSDLEHVETVFRSPKLLAKPNLFQGFHQVWENSVFTCKMHIWRRTRKRIQPIFAKSVVKFQMPLINESVDKYMKMMEKEIDGPEFDLNEYMPFLAVDSFVRIHFDLNLSKEQSLYFSFHKILNIAGLNGVTNIFIPWLRVNIIHYLYFKRSLSAAIDKLKEFINMIKDIHLPQAKENWDVKEVKIETLAKSLLSTARQLKDELKVDEYLLQEVGLLVCAAADTTSITASFFLLSVAMYPQIQEKLYDELCDIFTPGDDRPVTADDISRLPYLDQVVRETQRRFTLVPVIFRGVEEDIKIGSMVIPSGTTLMVRIGDIHLNPDLYPNPFEFNPENFSPEAVSQRSKYAWIPFSAGTRDCIGKTYAETALKVMLIGLLRRFKFSTTTKMEDIKYTVSFTVGKRDGFRVSITSRR